MNIMNEQLLEEIEQAARDKSTDLDLSEAGLTFLPAQIFQLSHLEWLTLDDNQLTFLPPEIAKLSKLKRLDRKSVV